MKVKRKGKMKKTRQRLQSTRTVTGTELAVDPAAQQRMPTGFSLHLFIYLQSNHLSSTSHDWHASNSPARTTHRAGWKWTGTASLLLFRGVCVRVYFASQAPDVCSCALENSPRRQKIRAVRWRCQPRRRARCSAGVALTACCGHSSVMTEGGSRPRYSRLRPATRRSRLTVLRSVAKSPELLPTPAGARWRRIHAPQWEGKMLSHGFN